MHERERTGTDERQSEATVSPNKAMRMLGSFMEEHAAHYGCHQPIIEAERIILLCDGHSPSVYEVIPVGAQAMRRAMGMELSEARSVMLG